MKPNMVAALSLLGSPPVRLSSTLRVTSTKVCEEAPHFERKQLGSCFGVLGFELKGETIALCRAIDQRGLRVRVYWITGFKRSKSQRWWRGAHAHKIPPNTIIEKAISTWCLSLPRWHEKKRTRQSRKRRHAKGPTRSKSISRETLTHEKAFTRDGVYALASGSAFPCIAATRDALIARNRETSHPHQ